MCPRLPSPPLKTTAISTSAAVPTRKEKVAACTPPTVLPRRALTGACMPTRQPAPTPSTTARPRLTRAASSCSLRLQPVPADADVNGQRRIAIPHTAHLARDQLTRGVGLRRRPLEQQLVVDREDQARVQAGARERGPAADHRQLDDVGSGALDDRVHCQSLAEAAHLVVAG